MQIVSTRICIHRSKYPIKTADYVQVFKGRHMSTLGARCPLSQEERIVYCENTYDLQPQAEILLYGARALQGRLSEPY